MYVECIDDKNWSAEALKWIKDFPISGVVYTVVKRNHCGLGLGLGYVLQELDNPLLPNGEQVGFSAKRFRPLPDIDLTSITQEETETIYY